MSDLVTAPRISRPSLLDLQAFDLFAELSADELQVWVTAAEVRDVAAGTVLVVQGEPSTGLMLILEGTVMTGVARHDGTEVVAGQGPGDCVGAVTALTGGPSAVQMVAETAARIAVIAPEEFVDLAVRHRSVLRRAVAMVIPITLRLSAVGHNRDRSAALGTMAAGLSHELNNPAAAAKRASAQLAEVMELLSSAALAFMLERDITPQQVVALMSLQMANEAAVRPPLDGCDAADAEDDLVGALTDAGVTDAWLIVESLVSAGIDRDYVAQVAAIAGAASQATLRWTAASLAARELTTELAESTERISTLVDTFKTYTAMDRGGMITFDLHQGLDTTLMILSHRLAGTQIEIVRDYDRALPLLTGHGAELNQVWTYLLDNAIDALGDSGTITITTRHDDGCVQIDIADDGPGIPLAIQDRVFDAFFTTKGIGNSPGLGLTSARRILAEGHRGRLLLVSQPGHTIMRARLPIDATRAQTA
jgi:signal transduction histidine kinase